MAAMTKIAYISGSRWSGQPAPGARLIVHDGRRPTRSVAVGAGTVGDEVGGEAEEGLVDIVASFPPDP